MKEEVTIICAYKVSKHKGTPGGNSVVQQEMRAMYKRNHPLADKPRLAFDSDMADFSIAQQNKGQEVFLFMDANTPLNSAESNKFLSDAGLHDVASYKFPASTLPRTFQSGSQCIDVAACSKRALNWVLKFGYFPFFAHALYDH